MKKYLPFQILIFVLFVISCSSDSGDPEPEPEPDVIAPTVTVQIAGSSNNSTGEPPVFSNQITININAQDAGGVAKVEAFINNQKVGEDNSAPFQLTIDLSNYSSKIPSTGKFQDYILKIVATDTSGNEGVSEQIIHIDNELPSVSNVSLSNTSIINGDTNAVTFEVSDNEGLTSVETYLNNILLQEITDEVYEININTLDLNDGNNIFKIVAVDLAQNTTNYEVNFIADNTGPTIALESLEVNQIIDEPTLFNPTVTDEYSDITSVEFLLGESPQLLIESAPNYEWELDPAAFATGAISVYIKALDALGNESMEEYPIEILRRLITIAIPANFYGTNTARLFVFASGMDGQLLDVERIYSDSEIIRLHTLNEIGGEFEYMLTFGEYISGSLGNSSEFTTVQNISPSLLPQINLSTYYRFSSQVDSYIIPTENFDFNDELNLIGQGFDYYGYFNQAENGPTGEISVTQKYNVNSSLKSSAIYLALYNNTLNNYSYALLDSSSLSNLVVSADMFSTQGIEQRFYEPVMNGQAFESTTIELQGYLSQEDFNNNVSHLIHNYGYGYIPPNGVPYFFNDAFSNYKYTVRINDYFTERTGEPELSFSPVDWTIDYTYLNNQITLTKSGSGHTMGKIFIDSDTPEIINGLNISYRWNIAFDSQKMDQILLPKIPEEIQTWGFYPIYENSGFKVQQVELKGFEGILDFDSFLNGVIKDNKFPYTISPKMESKFKSTSQGYYYRAPNFLLD
ncbi:Ig-like domain-containing protein [Flagellimonas aequoris]|uniref:Cadherin domain-containing protein n=1 Tax=Flagellimonas aequoris TaxID=2306997 RepID=A0A418N9C6_9FLAO|nr:Ig-like domain-containing protein [Allomuricauda aequoris]RIV72331.1 hypothetical protein D2U88_05315 [Allomuricauda aequoris]TXK04356.1 hypothetical protein FQ019_05275 [Allomuricauda aequoris]